MKLYVDALLGCDTAPATAEKPLRTLQAARDMAAACCREKEEPVTVYLRGTFRLSQTLTFGPQHSGLPQAPICYTSWGEEKAVVTMAREFTGFTLHDPEKNIWKVFAGEGLHTRQAWFNGLRGIRARTVGYLKNGRYTDRAYFLCDNRELLDLKYPQEVDMVFHINWCNPRYLIGAIEETKDGRVKIIPHPHFANNKARVDFAGPNRVDAAPAYLENAYEFLRFPGQWYLDRHSGWLYYIPRDGEDMTTMVAQLPFGERLIDASGSDGEHVVTDLHFENLCFEGTSWYKVDREGGYHDAQNGHIRERGNDFPPGAAVHFEHCRRIRMYNNVFRRIGVVGVEFMAGSKYVEFVGNELYDISGVGLTVDDVSLSGFPAVRGQDSLCEYIVVEHNYVHDVALDYKSSSAISLAWPRHSRFNHNEICAVSYSGFHISYGWEAYAETGSVLFDTEVNYNYVHDVFTDRVYDGGCIYTLGGSSLECGKTDVTKNNRMFGNFVANSWTCAMIYPDEGSSGWYVKGNVIDQSRVKFLENNLETKEEKTPWAVHMHAPSIKWMTFVDNYATCDYAYRYNWMNQRESHVEPLHMVEPGKWESWPDAAKQIMENAGVGEPYCKNFPLEGPKVLVCEDRRQSLALEKPNWAGFRVLGGKNREFDLKDYKLSMWMDDPDAVTLTPDGYYIAHKKGTFEGEVAATIGKRTYLHHVKLECGDVPEKLVLNVSALKMLPGRQAKLTVHYVTTLGNRKEVTEKATFALEAKGCPMTICNQKDGSVCVSSAADGRGRGRIQGTVTYEDLTLHVDMPAQIIDYVQENSVTPVWKNLPFEGSWSKEPVIPEDGGTKVCGTPNILQLPLEASVYGFDVKIQPGTITWPSFAICDPDSMGFYATNSCYMFMFRPEGLELQRFNAGARTVIFGAGEDAISGPAIAKEGNYAYGQCYHVLLGAEEVELGTRLYLAIDGRTIIDFVDEDVKRLQPKGYLSIYATEAENGGMTFWNYHTEKKSV